MYKKQNQLVGIVICLLDAGVMLCSLTAAGLLRYGTFPQLRSAEDLNRLYSLLLVLHVAAFYALKIHEDFFRRGRYNELLLSLKYNFILIAGAAFLGFSMKQEVFTSRLVMGYFFVINMPAIWLTHIFIRNRSLFLSRGNHKSKNLLIVTTRVYLKEVVESFYRSKEIQWDISGIVLLGEKSQESGFEGIPIVSDDEESYLEFATQHVVDEVFIRLDMIQEREQFLKKMILEFEQMGVVVNLNLDVFNLGMTGVKQIYNLEHYNVVAFSSRLFDYRLVLLKRAMDIVGGIVGLLITFVVGLILAPFLLLESPGPLIFKQQRVGMNGRVFNFYKFRSMYVDAEERKKELLAQNEMQGLMFKMAKDPRVTKVGAFIRRTSIDELPQFWNVLKGDMSLVGTRPPTLDEYHHYGYYQKRRLSFRPGLTGLWQISGRSDVADFDEVVRLDLEYIDNWSLLLDVKIIFKTVGVVLRGVGSR